MCTKHGLESVEWAGAPHKGARRPTDTQAARIDEAFLSKKKITPSLQRVLATPLCSHSLFLFLGVKRRERPAGASEASPERASLYS